MRALFAIALVACGGSGVEPPETTAPIDPPADAIAKTVEHGPVKATIKVWPPKPTLGEPIYARLEIVAPAGISIDAPFQEAGDQRLGRFRVLGFTRDTKPAATGAVHEQTYTLEAQTSGKHRVPGLRFEMLDARNAEKSAPQEVITEEVPLDIAPVPLSAAAAQLDGQRGELDPDVGSTSWLWVLAISAGVIALGVGAVVLLRGARTRQRIELQRSAYDVAIGQLRALESRGAPDAAATDAWFVELSAIVRRYLEQRYEIRAPELTTEEFLLVATARPELHENHRSLLTSFLERCDRVKFAGYRPDADESIATLKAARDFIEDTRMREAA